MGATITDGPGCSANVAGALPLPVLLLVLLPVLYRVASGASITATEEGSAQPLGLAMVIGRPHSSMPLSWMAAAAISSVRSWINAYFRSKAICTWITGLKSGF
uniref:Uncharacterized protein n=1 Tax=Mantoniella antarctica TaxID=81844 RepID=A0A6U3KDU6_9CHLO